MRLSHVANPLHQIEHWEGQYFRSAALWEVGVYLVIPHSDGSSICESLRAQIDFLDSIHRGADELDASIVAEAAINADNPGAHSNQSAPMHATSESDAKGLGTQFNRSSENRSNLESLIWDEEDIDELIGQGYEEEISSDDVPVPIPANWPIDQHADSVNTGPNIENQAVHPKPPSCDFLNNEFIRIVHTNGIHHLALLVCQCRGNDSAADLIHCGFMLASFVRHRTLFTIEFLDFQRQANLEMKV